MTMWILTGLSPLANRGKLFTEPEAAYRYLQGKYGVSNVTQEWRPHVPKKGKRSVEQPAHWQYWVKWKAGQGWDASQRYDLHEIEVIE